MIARLLTASILAFGLASLGYAQESVPAPAEAAITNASATAATPAAAPAPAPVIVDPKDYRIGREDLIEVLVWKNEELSRRVPVRPDGKISLALVDDIVAAGLTPNELKAQLTERISKFINPAPEVSVIVLEVHSVKVTVQGRVRMPGIYEIKSEATVLDMLGRAQGFADFADEGDITVIRRDPDGRQRAIKFKYDDATRAKDGANFLVQAGDIIVVK